MADDRPTGTCAWLLILTLILSLAAPASAAALPAPVPMLGPQALGPQEVHAKARPKDQTRPRDRDEAEALAEDEAEDEDTNATQGAEPSTWLLLATGLAALLLFHQRKRLRSRADIPGLVPHGQPSKPLAP